MEREDAARANALRNFAQGLCRVSHEMEDEAAYSGIEEPHRVERPRVQLAKLNVADSLRGSPLLGELESFSVEIDPSDRTIWADQRSHKEADIADSTTDIEHSHATHDPAASSIRCVKGRNNSACSISRSYSAGERPNA